MCSITGQQQFPLCKNDYDYQYFFSQCEPKLKMEKLNNLGAQMNILLFDGYIFRFVHSELSWILE